MNAWQDLRTAEIAAGAMQGFGWPKAQAPCCAIGGKAGFRSRPSKADLA